VTSELAPSIQVEPAAPSTHDAEDGGKPTLLLIDDTEAIMETCALEMRYEGFEVVTALGPIHGLAEMKRRSYDLVLCDFKMPHQNGAEVTAVFRHWESLDRGPGQHQKIFGLTAYPASVHAECIAAGMDGVLSKPIQLELVNDVIFGIHGGVAAI
jgi:CheY-like chemotaxis protein